MHKRSKGMDKDFRPFIHVGYPKAGSSSLQHNVFRNHPHLQLISGIRDVGPEGINMGGLFKPVHENVNDPCLPAVRSGCNHQIRPRIAYSRKPVISEEAFTSNRVPVCKVADRLYTLFPNADIIVVIRRQQEVLRSLYDMYPFMPGDKNRIPVRFSNWLDGQLENSEEGIAGSLKYGSVVEWYKKLFGWSKVHVLLFEGIFEEQWETVRLASILGLKPDDVMKRLASGARNDASIHAFRNLARRINGRFHLSWVLPRSLIRRLVEYGSHIYRGGRTQISQDDVERIAEFYALDNCRTAEILGVDLGSYGYLMEANAA